MKERATEERVREAAHGLKADGYPVTTRTVRNELGVGSHSTIGGHLDRLGLKDRRNVEPTTAVQDAVEELHGSFVRRTCQLVARELAASERAAAKKLSERVHHLAVQLKAEKTARNVLQLEVHQLRSDLHGARHRVAQLLAELAQKNEELAVEKALRKQAEKNRRKPAKATVF